MGYCQIARHLPKEECEGATILLIVLPEYNLDSDLIFWCQSLGFDRDNITVFHSDEANVIKEKYFDVIYVSSGNTFEILDYMRKNDLMKFIKDCVYQGACYVGASAGAHIAGMDVEAALAVEENYIGLTDFRALGLFHGIAIPHFDYSDRVRYEAYKRAIDSGKYVYVSTIGNDETEVISKEFHQILCEHACEKVKEVIML